MGIVTQFPVQLLPDAFLKDRSAFSGQTMDKEKMTFAAPYLKHALRSEFAIAERLLSENKDNEWVLGTETLSLADLHLAMDIWFANNMVGHEWTSENIPSLVKHMEKTLKAVGYDSIEDRPELSAEEALEVARTQKTEFSGSHDGSLPIQLGQPVTVTPTDTGKVPSTGVLVHSTVDETVIKHDDEKAGTSVFIHFPAIAYVVFPQKSKL
jgi:glutathione S-transferase